MRVLPPNSRHRHSHLRNRHLGHWQTFWRLNPLRREAMEIKHAGSQPSAKGPADWFTRTVRIDPLCPPPEPTRAAGALVTFEPGSRTAWHTHPFGQTLIV